MEGEISYPSLSHNHNTLSPPFFHTYLPTYPPPLSLLPNKKSREKNLFPYPYTYVFFFFFLKKETWVGDLDWGSGLGAWVGGLGIEMGDGRWKGKEGEGEGGGRGRKGKGKGKAPRLIGWMGSSHEQ